MSKPRHGSLKFHSDNWYFFPGKSSEGILLPDLQANCQHLLDSGQLFRGHTKFKNVYNTRSQLGLRDCVLRHVSAHGLKSLLAPNSLKHHRSLDPADKQVWDAAYDEEYDGLASLPTWEVITEAQYKQLRLTDESTTNSARLVYLLEDEFGLNPKMRVVIPPSHRYQALLAVHVREHWGVQRTTQQVREHFLLS